MVSEQDGLGDWTWSNELEWMFVEQDGTGWVSSRLFLSAGLVVVISEQDGMGGWTMGLGCILGVSADVDGGVLFLLGGGEGEWQELLEGLLLDLGGGIGGEVCITGWSFSFCMPTGKVLICPKSSSFMITYFAASKRCCCSTVRLGFSLAFRSSLISWTVCRSVLGVFCTTFRAPAFDWSRENLQHSSSPVHG